MQRYIALGCWMTFATVAAVRAQTNECVPPDAGLAIAGAVRDFKLPPSPACVAADYSHSYGPIIDYEAATRPAAAAPATPAAPAAVPQVQRPQPTGPVLGAGEGMDLYDLEAGTGGSATQYNGRELERLGQLDAMQGKPLNMDHASDINYVRGYTKGNERRTMPTPWR